MPRFNDPTVELTSLEKDDVLMSGSPTDFANIKAQNVFNTSLTRAALQTLISASELIIGHKYTITNAVTSTLVLVCEAVAVNKLNEIAINSSNGDNVSYDITTDIATAIQQTQINGNGFVKATGTTLSYDNSTYLTSIEGIAAGGELSGNYASPTLVNSAVTGKVLTGLSVTGSAVVSTDSVLAAIGKLQNQVNGLAGGVEYQGTWNASTNTPTLTSSVGTQGFYYVVSVAGSTNLNGITTWELGDWAIFNGTAWQKVDNTDAVVSVNGYTGIVTLSAADVSAVPTSSISGTSGTIPLFGASNTLGNSIVTQSGSNIAIGGGFVSYSGFSVLTLSNATNGGLLAIRNASEFGLNIFGTNNGGVIGAINGTKSLIFQTNDIDRLQILSNGQIITANAINTGEHFIIGGSARVNGTQLVTGAATFSSSVTSSGVLEVNNNAITQDGTRPIVTLKQSGTSKLLLGISAGASDIIVGDATGDVDFRTNAQAFNFSVDNGGSAAFKIASTGAATFSGSVTLSTSDARLLGGDATGRFIISNSSTDTYIGIYGTTYASTPRIMSFVTNNVEALKIASNQAATFSSSVTIGNKTTTEINALTPATGMTVFNTTLGTLCFYDGTAWEKVSHSAM